MAENDRDAAKLVFAASLRYHRPMAWIYGKITHRGEEAAEICGFDGVRTVLTVPEELEGLPVRRIGRRAFAGRKDFRRITLPDSLVSVGEFAFYGCSDLEFLSLNDGTEDLGDGMIRACGLRELELRVKKGSFRAVRDLLNDTDTAMQVRLIFPDGEALLYFPAFVNDFDEDTMARAIHPRIEGCGYAYREMVTRAAVNFAGYDALFFRAAADGVAAASETALARLQYPYRLTAEAEGAYERWLMENGAAAVRRLTELEDEARIRFLAERDLITPEAAGACIRCAAERKLSGILGVLMECEHAGGPAAPDEFEL